jgi:mersacidin/lichenicidin family type 2 lantibiotic
MKILDIIRFWKRDEEDEPTEELQTQLPPSPAGSIELSDKELTDISGGSTEICGERPFLLPGEDSFAGTAGTGKT